MAADMLLGDEQRWQSLTPNGTASFFKSDSPRMLVLARLELDDSMRSCCFMNTNATCHDAFVFRSPLHVGVRLDLFNFQQNVWQAENYAVGLLRLPAVQPLLRLAPLSQPHFRPASKPKRKQVHPQRLIAVSFILQRPHSPPPHPQRQRPRHVSACALSAAD